MSRNLLEHEVCMFRSEASRTCGEQSPWLMVPNSKDFPKFWVGISQDDYISSLTP